MRKKLIARILYYSALILICSCKHKETDKGNKVEVKTNMKELNEQIAAQPMNAELYFQRAKLYTNQKNTNQAFQDVSKAVSIDSSKVSYLELLADLSFKGLKIQNSVKAYERIKEIDPKNVEANLKLSEIYLYIKGYPKCLFYADEVLKIDKNTAKAYFLKGFAFKENGDTTSAISTFQTVVELQPENYDAYIQLGNIMSAKRNKVALQYYNNALKLQPKSTEALYDRGLMFQNMGNLDKAMADYYLIIKIDSSYADAYFNLGYIDLVFKKNYKSAIYHMTAAIRTNSMYAEAYYNRGLAYEFSGDRASAISDYRKAVDIVPTYKLAKQKLGK